MTTLIDPTNLSPRLSDIVERVCRKIAPLWPLRNFVATSPAIGLVDLPFPEADRILGRVAGSTLLMDRNFYRRQAESGRIAPDDLREGAREWGLSFDSETLFQALSRPAPKRQPAPLLLSRLREELDGRPWERHVVDEVSRLSASWFDMGQALWASPWKKESLFETFLSRIKIDWTPRFLGLGGVTDIVSSLPREPLAAIDQVLSEIRVPSERVEETLHAALFSVGGWASWARYRLWQAELAGRRDRSLHDLLAIRMAWELILFRTFPGPDLAEIREKRFREYLAGQQMREEDRRFDRIFQSAFEAGYRRRLLADLRQNRNRPASVSTVPRALAVFCIDVRSEIFRRALEAADPEIATGGFAGFFGIPAAVRSIGTLGASSHLPVLFSPAYEILEKPREGSRVSQERLESRRKVRLGTSKAWKIFRTSASSTFSFVEAAGLLSAGSLLVKTLGILPPSPPPRHLGLREEERQELAPDIDGEGGEGGIPVEDRPKVAASVLRNMGLTKNIPPLVLLVGHGSSTTNNPQSSALDCGACAGQTGEASARIAASLLNDPATRAGLSASGIDVPAETLFLAALHDTTTDSVTLFGADVVPESRRKDLEQVLRAFERAGEITRRERSVHLGIREKTPQGILKAFVRRTRDWAEVRPEWGLAGNAAFIVAPRERTAGLSLSGRAFLHNYEWREDPDFTTLELIMTAPLVVGHWINMQYYGSVVDNLRFGSGNKVLHNVVGGAIGVLEGNGGDLRTGISQQSLWYGDRLLHEPIRLHVVIEAPRAPIERVIGCHNLVRHLVDNGWIHLFRITEGGAIERRKGKDDWTVLEE